MLAIDGENRTMTLLTDLFEEEQFLAGEYVASGTYQQAGTNRTVRVDNAGYLPGSIDGNMCSYLRVDDTDVPGRLTQPFRANAWTTNAG